MTLTLMIFKVLQCNINHCWAAHDLLFQNMLELQIGLCAIAELVRIPKSIQRFSSEDGWSAIRWNPEVLRGSCIMAKRGQRFVAVKCCDVFIISSYVSPNLTIAEFLEFLEELSDSVHDLDGKIIMCGDYNAKSVLWGSPITDTRGEHIERWAAANDFCLANIGNSPTCVRPEGNSIIDLTWMSPRAVGMIDGWTVREDLETMSDHKYIVFTIGTPLMRPSNNGSLRRWDLSKMDKIAFSLSLEWACYSELTEEDNLPARESVLWIDKIMVEASDASSPRIGRRKPKRTTYW